MPAPHNSPRSDWIAKTRSGARAARGFHFQDTVGAWLSVQILSDRIDAHSITPEGKDDLVLIGSAGDHLVQVKSKQAHVAPFSASEIARLLLDGLARANSYGATRVTVCLESIDDQLPSLEWDTTLIDLSPSDLVRVELERLVAATGASPAQVEDASRTCGFVVLPWRRAEHEALGWLIELQDLHVPQVAEPILNGLRQAIADTSDANAPSHLAILSSLTRADLNDIAAEILRTTDSSHLAEALESGLCTAVRFQPATTSENYYEGVSTQPRHVTAGLVFQPAGVLDSLYERLTVKRTLLLSGPSGIGKSARAWSLAKHVPSVMWFRIHRLSTGDAAVVSRFADAMRSSEQAPVAFIFDQLGASAAPEFEELRRRFADAQHTFLLATVRNEDLPTVLSAHELDVASVELDEGTAEGIFRSLQARGLAVRSSWREAFDQSDGLTLEFTHMLTQGQRLSEVIDAQINERLVDPERSNEISILALVCQADSWGVALSAPALQKRIQLDDGAMRRATARLAREHMIAIPADDQVRGLHPLRSKAIAAAVHRNPPPTEASTRQSLLAIVDDSDVGAIALGALRDGSDSGVVVADLLHALKGAAAPRIASALRGARLDDFGRIAETWCRALDEAGVPPALVDITASLHITGSDVDGLPLHPSIPEALGKLRDLKEDLPTHRRIIQELGLHDWHEAFENVDDIRALTDLLAALGPNSGWMPAAQSHAVPSRTEDLLRDSELEDLAQCIATARWIEPSLADRLAIMAGGEDAALKQIKDSDRFMTAAEIRSDQGEAVATARLLHISDTLQPDPERRVRDLAGLMLRALPKCDRADVQATLVGSHSMDLNGLRPWESGLLRRYAISGAEVAWNRTRGLVVQQVMRERLDAPARSETIPALIAEAADFLARLTTAWSTSRDRAGEADDLNARRLKLAKQIDDLLPPSGQHRSTRAGAALVQLAQRGGTPEAASSDDVHTLLAGLVHNLPERLQQPEQWGSLAAFCHDTLSKALFASADEVHDSAMNDVDAEIEGIDKHLRDLHSVLAELAWGGWTAADVTDWATAGPYESALARAAVAARSAADLAAAESASRIAVEGQAADLEFRVHRRDVANPVATNWPPVEYAIGVVLNDTHQWASSSALAGQIVDRVLPTGHAPTLIYPLIDGRAVGNLAQTRITSSHPGADSFATWVEDLPDVAPTSITDAVVKAHQALQEMSGLIAMDSLRPEVDYQGDVDAAASRFREAMDELQETRDNEGVVDDIVEVLTEAAARVGDEKGEDPTNPPGSLAEQVAAGCVGNGEPPEWTTMNALLVVAVLCDVNPQLARKMLDADPGE